MQVRTFFFNPFRECTYLLTDEAGETTVIDCGCYTIKEQERLASYITANNLHINRHLLTHAHLDHVFGARFIYERYGVLPILSELDDRLFMRLDAQAAAFDLPLTEEPLTQYLPCSELKDITVIPTPGHTPGSVCYYLPDEKLLFSGDTLFQGGIGRTDLPGGNYADLIHSLQKLITLPPETTVYPGHGYPTTIREEQNTNPYL